MFHRRRRLGLSAISLSAALAPQVALAATDAAHDLAADPVPHSEVIVVTATSHEQSLDKAPASIAVVDREEIDLRLTDDLSDALTGVPGVAVTGVGQSRKGISLRGMPVEHTLYLLDGRRINSSNAVIAHSDFELGWLPSNAIKRIEVVRGPMSSLYGADALGGVVNVISRVPNGPASGEVSAEGRTLFQGKDGSSYKLSGYVEGEIVPDLVAFSLAGQLYDRANLPDPADPNLSEIEARQALGGRAAVMVTPAHGQRIDLVYNRNQDDRQRDTIAAGRTPTYYRYADDVSREHMALGYRGEWAWGSARLNAYQSRLERINSRNNGQTPTRPQAVRDRIVDGHVVLPLFNSHKLTVGGQLRDERLTDTEAAQSGVSTANHRSIFVQEEFEITGDVSLVGGVRFDHHDRFGWETSPRIYAVIEPAENLIIKGGYGQGFKAPSLTELSPDFRVLVAGRFFVVGNPTLKPELSETYEAGIHYDGDGWGIGGMLFRNNLKNLIEVPCVADCGVRGREIRRYSNVARSRIAGVELAAHVDIVPSLRLEGNYNFLDADNLDTGEPLNNRARHRVYASLGWHFWDEGVVRARSEWVGKQRDGSGVDLPSYSLHHVDFIVPISDRLRLNGGVENVFDTHLADKSPLFSFAEPGRTYRLGVTARF